MPSRAGSPARRAALNTPPEAERPSVRLTADAVPTCVSAGHVPVSNVAAGHLADALGLPISPGGKCSATLVGVAPKLAATTTSGWPPACGAAGLTETAARAVPG